MSETDDDSDEARARRDALELRSDEIDADTRDRHLARALEAFDDAPRRVVPLSTGRHRRRVSIAAAAAVLVVVAAVGVLIANRGDHPASSRAGAPPSTSASVRGDAASSVADAASPRSVGDFPSVAALRVAMSAAGANSSRLDATPRDYSAGKAPTGTTTARAESASSTTGLAPTACTTPPLDGGHVVARVTASVNGAPVIAWVVEGSTGARDVIVVDAATCTVRPR